MSREFYVPCAPYAFPCGSNSNEGIVSVNSGIVGNGGGMDCMPLRPGPFHYLINEQAKSLVALQELQNEVGALLEFRDLVIEAFPNLRQKMSSASSTASSTSSHNHLNQSNNVTSPTNIQVTPSNQTQSTRRAVEWEPGKVRRRIPTSSNNGGAGSNSSSTGSSNGRPDNEATSLPRSRSNSQSGNNKHSATVQDSGFSTETSSKDSASTAIPRPTSPKPVIDEAEDELWNLLDVIHRKGVRLREEVECLQGRLESVAPEDIDVPADILEACQKISHPDLEDIIDDENDDDSRRVAKLQREKLQLLDKVSELEAEVLSSRIRAQELQVELTALSGLKNGVENRLRESLGDAVQRIQPIANTLNRLQAGLITSTPLSQSPAGAIATNIKSKDSSFANFSNSRTAHRSRFRTRTIDKNVLIPVEDIVVDETEETEETERVNVGSLDKILGSPSRIGKVEDVPGEKIAAILLESNPLELRRHLITSIVHNQVLQKSLDEFEKNSESMSETLGKVRDENEDLRFQLAERNIELEGTRARVRVLERQQHRPATEAEADDESENCLIDLHNDHDPGGGSSSLESSRDQQNPVELRPSPRRRPSRIPLLGVGNTKQPASKLPSSHNGYLRNDSKDSLKSLTRLHNLSSSPLSSSIPKLKSQQRDSSRESLNKSLTKSTNNNNSIKESSRESMNRSLTRNNIASSNNRDSLTKQSRDSFESSTSRRLPAPARRSQSQASRPSSVVDNDPGKVRSVKQYFWTTWLK